MKAHHKNGHTKSMNKYHAFSIVIASIALLGATGLTVAANPTQDVTVSATVSGNCKFNTGQSPALAFGTLDPSIAPAAAASVNVLYRCTNGTTATVSANNGLHWSGTTMQMQGPSGTDLIAYTITPTGGAQTGTGFGSGNDLTYNISGSISAGAYSNAKAGGYSDTITLTISP